MGDFVMDECVYLLCLFFVGGMVGVDGLDWFVGDYGVGEIGCID